MKQLHINYLSSCGISEKEFTSIQSLLTTEIDRLSTAQQHGYDTQYASINLPYDQHSIQHIKNIAAEKRTLNPTTLIIIGIGGSNLGTAAILQALYGTLYNEISPI